MDELLSELKDDSKNQILATVKGIKSVRAMSQIFFPYDEVAGDKWMKAWTPSEKRKAFMIVYSHLKRTKKEIIFRFVAKDSFLGHAVSYEKGMKLIESLGIKV